MFTLTQIQSGAISARIAMIVGAETFDRLFAGVAFSEVEGEILFVFAATEQQAAEIEDTFALHISIIASEILHQQIDIVMCLPRVLH